MKSSIAYFTGLFFMFKLWFVFNSRYLFQTSDISFGTLKPGVALGGQNSILNVWNSSKASASQGINDLFVQLHKAMISIGKYKVT